MRIEKQLHSPQASSQPTQVIYFPFNPPPPLQQFVETIFFLSGYGPEHAIERIVPDTSASLVIELDDQERWIVDNDTCETLQSCKGSWISGPHRKYFSIRTAPDTELLAVRFRLGGLFPLLREPVETVTDRVVDGQEILGGILQDLRSEILKQESPEQKVQTAYHWLEQHMDVSLTPQPAILDAIEAIAENPSQSTLAECVQRSGFSQKHLIQLFKKHTGLRPRDLQRILRFSQALTSIQEGHPVSWTTLSLDCGYTDQSHLIRDFKNFSGFTPEGFRAADSDRENFFPVDEPER
ncbi:MAG: DUF6597 domain-containing transcriptional factor [Pirellulaceae bacterium]